MQLMRAPHQWGAEKGYDIIQTVTLGNNRAMLIANLKCGYSVVGTYLDREKHLKVILQKRLGASESTAKISENTDE